MGNVKALGLTLLITISLVLDVSCGFVPYPQKYLPTPQTRDHEGALKGRENHRRRPFADINEDSGNSKKRIDFYEASKRSHQPEHPVKWQQIKHDQEDFFSRMARADAKQLEDKHNERIKQDYSNYELGDLYDTLQRWKEKKDEGFWHKFRTFIAEYVSLPMELFGRKVIEGVVQFFKLLGMIFDQSRGIIFLLSASYVILILLYFIVIKCCFRSRRGQSQCIREKFSSYYYLHRRSTDSRFYPKTPSDTVPIVIVDKVSSSKKGKSQYVV